MQYDIPSFMMGLVTALKLPRYIGPEVEPGPFDDQPLYAGYQISSNCIVEFSGSSRYAFCVLPDTLIVATAAWGQYEQLMCNIRILDPNGGYPLSRPTYDDGSSLYYVADARHPYGTFYVPSFRSVREGLVSLRAYLDSIAE